MILAAGSRADAPGMALLPVAPRGQQQALEISRVYIYYLESQPGVLMQPTEQENLAEEVLYFLSCLHYGYSSHLDQSYPACAGGQPCAKI